MKRSACREGNAGQNEKAMNEVKAKLKTALLPIMDGKTERTVYSNLRVL